MRSYLRITTLLILAVMLQPGHYRDGIALAQETRAETIAQKQEEKSASPTPAPVGSRFVRPSPRRLDRSTAPDPCRRRRTSRVPGQLPACGCARET